MSIELIAIIIALAIGVTVYLSAHKATETKLLASLQAVNAFLVAHSTALNDIEGLLTAHGLTLGVLEDKAKNVLTEIEANKAVQRIADAAATAKAEIDKVLGNVTPAAPAAADLIPPSPAITPDDACIPTACDVDEFGEPPGRKRLLRWARARVGLNRR